MAADLGLCFPVRAGRCRTRPTGGRGEGGNEQLTFGGVIGSRRRLEVQVIGRRRRRLGRAKGRRLALHDTAAPCRRCVIPVVPRGEGQFAAGRDRPYGKGPVLITIELSDPFLAAPVPAPSGTLPAAFLTFLPTFPPATPHDHRVGKES